MRRAGGDRHCILDSWLNQHIFVVNGGSVPDGHKYHFKIGVGGTQKVKPRRNLGQGELPLHFIKRKTHGEKFYIRHCWPRMSLVSHREGIERLV